MSSDKRSVTTDALETLGTILTENEKRDAIHLAVEPVVAAERLRPGEDVGFVGNGEVGRCKDPVGLVDPFLKGFVEKGERFWLVVYPRQITSLRHVWTHPAFPEESPNAVAIPTVPASTEDRKKASEAWLRDFAASNDCPDYDTLIAAAVGDHEKNARSLEDPDGYPGYYNSRNDGEYLHFGGRDAHGEIPPEFWDHVSVVAGREIPKEKRAEYFSCSC